MAGLPHGRDKSHVSQAFENDRSLSGLPRVRVWASRDKRFVVFTSSDQLARRQTPGRKLTPMTAIAWVYTPEGFVIGADGRQLNPRRRIESDDIVKIASYSATNVQAVGAWTGRLMFGGSAAYFDVKLQAIEIAESSAARNSQPCWNMLGRSRGASLYVFRNG